MQLKRLSIQRLESWESKGAGFKGEITATSPNTEISIRLNDECCRKILEVAGAGIKASAAETADFLHSQATLLEADKTLEISNG